MNEQQASVAGLLDVLDARQAEVGEAMAAAIVREVDTIRMVSGHDPAFRLRFEAFCQQHVRTFVSTTRQGRVAGPGDLTFVREVAERRADDAFPLPALLEGLRIGHRVLSRRISQFGTGWSTPAAAVLWLSNRLLDYMDAAGAELADSYRARQTWSAGRTDVLRREVLDDLLEGRYASRPDAAMVAASLGFEPDEQYCVAVVVAAPSSEVRPHSLAATLARAAFGVSGFRFVVIRGDEIVGVFRAVDTQAILSEAHVPLRAGVSTRCRGITEVARGYWEAVRAVRFASEQRPCVDLGRLGPLRYLEFSADSVAQHLARQLLGDLKPNSGNGLADTVVAYVECGLSARLAAEQLGVHLNTVHNRLERVAELLGRSELGPVDLVEAASAIRICRNAERDASTGSPAARVSPRAPAGTA